MKEIIGNRIKKMRIEQGFSQEDLAEKLDISRSALVRMENGESSSWANKLEKLSEVFGVSPEELVKEASIAQNIETMNGGMALQHTKIKKINYLNEKVIELFEARLREKDEVIAMLKEKIG